LAEARKNLRPIQERKSEFVMATDIPLQLVKQEQELLERIEELEQRVERSEGPSEQAARLGPLYEQLQAAAARQEWAEVLVLGGRIQALDPAYRDVPERMAQARDRLCRPPRRAWLWPVVGGAVALVVVIGIAVVVVPRLIEATTPVGPPAEANIGDTWTRPADGMVMVYVPAGEFLMGSSEADALAEDDEKPQHTVYLDAFWIDRTEVTNAQYRKCVEAGACLQPGCWDNENYNAPDQPVVCVTWDDARAYAAWAGGRLPTEAEWEKAARGTDGRIYPWGNSAPGCDKANYEGCVGRSATVGSYLTGASPYGVLDMAGNVQEWVADWYDGRYYGRSAARNPEGPDSGEYRVLRGGSWYRDPGLARCASRSGYIPDNFYSRVGLRVVVSRAPG
jgi:formylglycine-generating enzyme required for sulfatase activity